MNNQDLLVEVSADAPPVPVSTAVIAEEMQKLIAIAHQAGQELEEIVFSTKFNQEGRLVLTPQGLSLKFRRPGTVGAAPMVMSVAPVAKPGDMYDALRSALAQGNWQQANQETWHLLCQDLGKPPGTYISKEEMGQLSCELLQTIDRLWLDYSQGKFGFSVQQELFQK
ncbi:MAG: GUN4 domain-containing protein [Pseudanabaenaceae cyanobacterium]